MSEEQKPESKDWSVFKRTLVRHRRQGNAPNRLDDLSEMVDFSNPSSDSDILPLTVPTREGVKTHRGPLFGLKGFPGFVYAPAALAQELQEYLAFQAVSTYCESPHVTNIDSVPPKDSETKNLNESMWAVWKAENGFGATPSKPLTKKRYRSFQKLSWATMGYHYDWSARAYNKAAKSFVPHEMQELGQVFAKTSLLLQGGSAGTASVDFTASASIVNYYHSKSVMGGHRDDLELALDKPIVSLSMGRPAVFLLGGLTKDEGPVRPILIRPGDVLMMGGASRLRYHAMARLLPCTLPPAATAGVLLEEAPVQLSDVSLMEAEAVVPTADQEALAQFLTEHRINVNVRQVYSDE